jgi:RNA polymerase sigma-70 factor (ECF subfamily)
MTYNQPLTLEQQRFAEDNHNLVYSFLRFKRLSHDEYYDVIIFGYLRAVRKYFERPELRRYKFNTIAYQAMKSDLYNYYRKLYRQKRYAVIVSFDNPMYAAETSMIDIAVEDTAPDIIAYEQLLQEISSVLSAEQFSILQMRADGYNEREIAKHYNIPVYSVQEILSSVRERLSPSLV